MRTDDQVSATAPHTPTAVAPGPWVFPVPDIGDRRPEVSDGWGSTRHNPDGSRRLHLGVDIMFRRRSKMDLIDVYRPGTPHATTHYFMPDNVPALAVATGVVVFAAWTARGFTVRIRHANGWTSRYTHLALLAVAPRQEVAAGQPIGSIGWDPMDRRRLMHLHFDLWRGSTGHAAVNPKPYLDAWQHRAIESMIPRNASAFRSPGKAGERFPAWLQALGDKSGAYAIRERKGGKTITRYVGHSGASRLYDALTRHMQVWLRHKGHPKGQPGHGNDPGIMYDRNKIEVSVAVTKPDDAAAAKQRLIRTLRPTDNIHGQPRDEAA